MKGPDTSALAVRKPDGEIFIETWTNEGTRPWYKKTPIVRGMFNFFDSMKSSYKCLMRSAEIAGVEDEDPSKFEKWLMERLGDKFATSIGFIAMMLGMLLAVGLFMILPTYIIGLARPYITSGWLLSLVEAITKIGIFILYIFAISRMDEIRRTFEYHGAEHKTIACYEEGLPLTVENVRKQSRYHPRCGTSFILIVLIVSVMIFSMVTWSNLYVRILLKLVSLPLVVGIAYEIIKLAGRYDNIVTRTISAPGLWLQRMTTREPDDSEIECAIASMLPCIPESQNEDRW